ncbi:MFS transporter [Hugonella massiliensis]|uniref:MFS transporter n=1 Tax=Hugonella massiliensis TaxID=1720315 RepID=UPI00073F9B72|nr:MFS transporter [Hugonella massiliensis]MDD6730589.1 MFS transporter [Eggerthellaceae bacterium]
MARKTTTAERSWILYDVGNSAFVLLSTALIPVYFSSIATGSVMVAWGYAETVAALIVALLMPFLGSLADMPGMKKKFLAGCAGTGACAACALGLPTDATAFLIVYVIAAVLLNASTVFYDAFLVDVTTPDRFDEVSSAGYAWGYVGSCVPFIACLGIALGHDAIGLSMQTAMQTVFAITAAWWFAFTIPVLRNARQVHSKPRPARIVRDSLAGLAVTCKRLWQSPPLRSFMLAYFFYIDGVHTIIKLSTSYGTDLGIDGTQLVLALLATQFVAFPAAIAYGKLGRRFGTKQMLLVGVVGYTCIVAFAAFFLRSAAEFWMLAIMVGLFQGGIQALSRSEFGKLVPSDHANEYFGFFDIFGKYAAVMGTFLVSALTQATGNGSIGVLSIAILFVVGFFLLRTVPDRPTEG